MDLHFPPIEDVFKGSSQGIVPSYLGIKPTKDPICVPSGVDGLRREPSLIFISKPKVNAVEGNHHLLSSGLRLPGKSSVGRKLCEVLRRFQLSPRNFWLASPTRRWLGM
ncbi:hypothetical protein GUJ93_ZPchr0009g1532 [Zizania palustris]|uniref:Uncharacterized protein n=1 Tax=Zizania palustris TaxID=103762 RepID=A0A8J5RSY3_ZIZPA|nr:hypothetical protein GUJ93_ZPchr0009g1532 [Zizania palustris]